MTLGVWQMRPHSTGHVRALSADVTDAPEIQPNYLTDPADQHAIVQGLKWCRRLFASDALAAFRGPEPLPGADIRPDDGWLTFDRAKGETVYQPVRTFRRGHGTDGVVGPGLGVRGT